MATKLFVGSLAWATTSDELRDVFAKAGQVVEANVVMDKQTGKSRGFGFVEMANDADAKKAVDTLNGTDLGGRKIFVSEARPQKDDSRGSFGDSASGAKDEAPAKDEENGDAAEAEVEAEEPETADSADKGADDAKAEKKK